MLMDQQCSLGTSYGNSVLNLLRVTFILISCTIVNISKMFLSQSWGLPNDWWFTFSQAIKYTIQSLLSQFCEVWLCWHCIINHQFSSAWGKYTHIPHIVLLFLLIRPFFMENRQTQKQNKKTIKHRHFITHSKWFKPTELNWRAHSSLGCLCVIDIKFLNFENTFVLYKTLSSGLIHATQNDKLRNSNSPSLDMKNKDTSTHSILVC